MDTLLNSLTESGIVVLEAIDIIYEARLYFQTGISTKKIIKIINSVIESHGYGENFFIKSETTIPIMISIEGKFVELSFKLLKELTREYLSHMRYTSKTFRDLIDELHRSIIGMETFEMDKKDIFKLIPVSLRNIIGKNPFDTTTRCVEDFGRMKKLRKSIDNIWVALPSEERVSLLKNYFTSAFRVILLSFNFLPGHIANSTYYQINNLITHLTTKDDKTLSGDEINKLSISTQKISEIEKSDDPEYSDWADLLDTIDELCEGLMSTNAIRWIVGRTNHGNELFAFSSNEYLKEGGKNTGLISSALYGIEMQLNEITKSSTEILDQGDKVILINKRETFSVLALVDKPVSHLIRQKLQELTFYVEENFNDKILNFKGEVTEYQDKIQNYLEMNFSNIFQIGV